MRRRLVCWSDVDVDRDDLASFRYVGHGEHDSVALVASRHGGQYMARQNRRRLDERQGYDTPCCESEVL